MRVVLSWLREFVPVEAEPDEIAARLSLSTVTVDEVVRTGAGISGVVVGEVRTMREHPNAESLMLVKAFDGERERDIVCGARNYAPGDRVPLALPGARLPGGVEIGERTVRGERSEGMLCSARELRISDDHTGIMVLDPAARLGLDLVAALELDDVVFDLDVTPDRPDVMSVLGVAREVAVLFGLPLTVPTPIVPESGEDVAAKASVRVEDPDGCPRYIARVVEGVRPGPSPWWMRRRLLAAGMRPISNIVDITNYVMLELGQPLHAFDLDRLAGAAIVVRGPRPGESITTLDGQERALAEDDVVICDAERPVAVGGIMGGAESEVGETTTRLLLEAANFDPVRIARTSRRLGLRTEASVRFERGADRLGIPAAADRACELLAELAGGTVARAAIDVYERPYAPRTIGFRVSRANALSGLDQPEEEMRATLLALGCEVTGAGDALEVEPPSYRPDLAIEEDLVEEVVRIHGYDRVPETLPAGARTGGLTGAQERRRRAAALLRDAGLSEAQTLSLLPPWVPDRLGLPGDHPWRAVRRVTNPLSEEESVLRPSLLPGLLLAARRNVAHRVLPVALFEIGVRFTPTSDAVTETRSVAWVLAGPTPMSWHAPERPLDLFDARGVLDALQAGLGVVGLEVVPAPDELVSTLLHPGRAARVLLDGAAIGVVAELHPRAAEALELPGRVAICELDLDPLLEAVRSGRAPEIPRFPSVRRDVAVVVPDDIAAFDVARRLREAAGPSLASLELFDVYRGDPIPAGRVSLAFALELRDPERTLTDADADAALAGVADAARAAGWTVRD